MLRRMFRRVLCVVGLVVCAPFLYLGVYALSTRPGIGHVEKAQTKIKPGMSMEEVRSFPGKPHREPPGGPAYAEWDYWSSRFVDCILRIYFGPDGRVTGSEWWVQ